MNAVLLAFVLVSTGTRVAYAHALLDRAQPGAGTVVVADSPPSRVSLWFSEPVSVAFNSIAVLDSDNRRVDKFDAQVSATDPRQVDVSVAGLSQGPYVARWQAVSADNHVVRGSYWFAIGFATAPPPGALATSDTPTAPPLEVAGRALTLAAILTLAGAAFFRVLVTRRVETDLAVTAFQSAALLKRQQLLWLSAAAGLFAGQVLWAAAQAESIAGVALPQALTRETATIVFFDSSFGVLWWARLVLGLTLAGGLLVSTRARRRQRARLMWLQVANGCMVVASVSVGSHAASARAVPLVAVTVDAIHLAAASLWLGGLLMLAVVLPPMLGTLRAERAALLRVLVPRVSTVALISVGILVLTGLFSAWEQVATFDALLETPYGQSLLLKLGLLAFLLATAAINLLFIRPRAAAGRSVASIAPPRVFHRLVITEVLVGGTLLAAVGLLSSLPPPGTATLPGPVQAVRQAGDLRVNLAVDPNWVGVSHFRVALVDERGTPPDDVLNVVLTFSMQGMNMGRTTVFATPNGDGVYDVTGFYVGMPGLSQVGVSVSRSSGQDVSAVFVVDVPDLSHKQFEGLRQSVGVGPIGLLGLALAVITCLAAMAWRHGSLHAGGVVTTGLVVMLVGSAAFVIDNTRAVNASGAAGGLELPPGLANTARGKPLYEDRCMICHGQTGVGNGPAAASLLPPPSDLTLHARWHPDEQLYWFISNGVAGTAMPAWANELTPAERRDVIGYLHELADAPTATPLVAPTLPVSQATASPPMPATVAQPTPQTAQGVQTITAAVTPIQAAPTAGAASPIAGLSGRMVFGPDTDGNLWAWAFPAEKPDKLTNFGPGEYSSNPVWSPDGRLVAFSYYKLPRSGSLPIPDGTDLYLANADGTQQRLLVQHTARGVALQFPAWAPDGRSIYISYRDLGGTEAHIDRVDVESGARSQVVANAGFPAISADGRKLAYATSPARAAQGGTTLMWSGPDGEDAHQILGPLIFQKYYGLRISPDGQHLLFAAIGAGNNYVPPGAGLTGVFGMLGGFLAPPVAYADGEAYDLWKIDLDGRNLQRVTTLAEDLPIGAWSPDGQHIAFLGGGSATLAQSGMAVVKADGTQLRRLTGVPGHRGIDWAAFP